MKTNEAILSTLLERGVFDNEEQKVSGIAKLAIDKSYGSLSPAQQSVVSPWLSDHCSGSTDPGGHHNGCCVELSGAELLEALELADDVECIQCESCRNDDSYYDYQYNKLMAE